MLFHLLWKENQENLTQSVLELHGQREEELKWALRAKVTKVVQRDDNTQFLDMIANEKHRKKKLIQLEHDEGTIVGQENLKLYISNFSKKLFGAHE